MGILTKRETWCASAVAVLLAATFVFYTYGTLWPYGIKYFFQTKSSLFAIFDSKSQNLTIYTRRMAALQFPNQTSDLVQPWEKCDLSKISGGRNKNDGRWFNFSRPHFAFFAYNAFIDNRTSLLSKTPILRILGITSMPHKIISSAAGAVMYTANFSCVLYFNNSTDGKFTQTTRTVKSIPMPRISDEGYGVHGKYINEFVFGCELDYENSVNIWPQAVSIIETGGLKPENCMPVEVPVTILPKKDFVCCVAVTFGYINPWRWVQWFEIIKMLGVSKVHITDYGRSIAPESLKVLEYYEDQGFVEVYTSSPFSHGDRQHYWIHNRQAINDCMYRNLNQFNYIVVIDVDEFIMPTKKRSLLEIVKYLDEQYEREKGREKTPSFYEFLNGYYFLNEVSDNTTLITYQRHERVNLMGKDYNSKTISKMDVCVAMHNHRCSGMTPAHAGPNYIRIDVNPSDGMNRQYKRCHFDSATCAKKFKEAKLNDEFRPYTETLKQAAIPAFQKIFNRLPKEMVRNNIKDLA